MSALSLRFLLGQVAVYGFSDAGVKTLSVVSVVIFTRIFAPEDYGAISLIASFVGVLNAVGGLGLSAAMQRDYFAVAGDQRALSVSTSYWGLLGSATAVTAAGIMLAPAVAYLTFGSFETWTVYALALLSIPAVQGLAFCQDIIRVHFRPWRFSIVAITNQLAQIAIGVLLVLGFGAGLYGLFTGMLVGAIVAFALGTMWISSELRLEFSWSLFRRFVGFGAPLMVAGLSFPVFMFADRFILGHFKGEAAVGHFAIATSIAQVLVLISGSFSKAWNAVAWKLRYENPHYRKIFADVLLYLIAVFATLAVAIAAFAHEIVGILAPPAFSQAAIAVAPLTAYMLANVSIQVTAAGISITGRTRYLTVIVWVSIALNLVLDILLIPFFGIFGAALATAIAETVMTVTLAWVSQRLHALPYDYRRIGICVAIFIVFLSLSYQLPDLGLVFSFLFKGAFVATFVGLLFALNVVSWRQLRLTAENLAFGDAAARTAAINSGPAAETTS